MNASSKLSITKSTVVLFNNNKNKQAITLDTWNKQVITLDTWNKQAITLDTW